jgi:hypothetical protein
MIFKKSKGFYKTIREDGLFSFFFVEPSREKKIKNGRSRFKDIFIYRFFNIFSNIKFFPILVEQKITVLFDLSTIL